MRKLIFGGVDGLGISQLRNMANVADPSVTRRDGGYWMVLGAMDPARHVIDLYSAESATPTDDWRIVTEPDDPKTALRIAEPPKPGDWDATGYHCPSYANGFDGDGNPVERIYYASSAEWTSLYGPYQIGFLQWDGRTWQRHPAPVFSATQPWELGTVLEPNVHYADGRWLMHYTAGLGEGRRTSTAVVASADGIGDWWPLDTPNADRFDTFVLADRAAVVVSRHPLDGNFTEDDGLWLLRGETSRQILRTTDGTAWHNLGAWKPTALLDGEELVVFCTVMQGGNTGPVPLFGIGCVVV
jgi:hypothetical protein